MKNYTINLLQLSKLANVLGLPAAEIARKVGIQYTRFSRLVGNGNFTVQEIVRLCNSYRISPSRLVSVDNRDGSPWKDFTPEDKWKNVEFDFCAFKRKFWSLDITMTEACRRVGCARGLIEHWLNGEIKLDSFLKMCNGLQWNVSEFISNSDVDDIFGQPSLEDEVRMLRKENERLRAIIKSMTEKRYDTLSGEFEILNVAESSKN